jgi:hypothetical protein
MTDWQRITATREGWETFCFCVGMKTVVRATELVREEGLSLAEALNQGIEWVAESIEADGAPPGLADAYRRDYRADRANQMQLLAASIASYPPEPRKRQKRS